MKQYRKHNKLYETIRGYIFDNYVPSFTTDYLRVSDPNYAKSKQAFGFLRSYGDWYNGFEKRYIQRYFS